MPRNFRRRVEVLYPICDEALKARMIEEVLGTMRSDGLKSWELGPDSVYERPADASQLRSQQRFIDLARERAREAEGIWGISTKSVVPAPASRALDKLRRRPGKKRKRRHSEQ
jgi:polyphosphate kinase